MVKAFSLSALASVVVGAAVFAGCASAPDAEPVDQTESAASTQACHWKCGKCPPNKICALACTQVGNCGTQCLQTMLCIEGYTFDEQSCRCVPSGGGVACGAGTCAAGDVCCNDSCGICTPPGGACTMQLCVPL